MEESIKVNGKEFELICLGSGYIAEVHASFIKNGVGYSVKDKELFDQEVKKLNKMLDEEKEEWKKILK